MKMNRSYLLLVPVISLMLSCSLLSGIGIPGGGVDTQESAAPVRLNVQLDVDDATRAVISPEGGTLTHRGADGNTYTLRVPAGALYVETEISMTTVASIDGAATGDGVFAVQLEPSGLAFNDLVTLSITPAVDAPIEELTFFKYEGAGEEPHYAMIDPTSEGIEVLLLDFSGIGFGLQSALGSIFNGKIMAERPGLERDLGLASQQLRKEKTEAGKRRIKKEIESRLDQHRKAEVDSAIRAAQSDCSKVNQAEEALRKLEALRGRFGSGQVSSGDAKARAAYDKLKCPRDFTINGSLTPDIKIKGVICNVRGPFTLTAEGPGDSCTTTLRFSGGYSGYLVETSTCPMGVTGSFSGSYDVNLSVGGKAGSISSQPSGQMDMGIMGKGPNENHTLEAELKETIPCQ